MSIKEIKFQFCHNNRCIKAKMHSIFLFEFVWQGLFAVPTRWDNKKQRFIQWRPLKMRMNHSNVLNLGRISKVSVGFCWSCWRTTVWFMALHLPRQASSLRYWKICFNFWLRIFLLYEFYLLVSMGWRQQSQRWVCFKLQTCSFEGISYTLMIF